MSFINELKRRNVVRSGLAYLAVAWLVIQLVSEIGPILAVPDWLPRLVLGLLALGFPVTLVLSWVYELTNQGLRKTEEVDRDSSLVSISGRKLDFFIIGALTVALGYFIWESRFAEAPLSGGAEGAVESIAVLPFADLSSESNQAYFADGMAEELLNALSRLPGLRVAGRTSSFQFRNSELPPKEIASQLDVTHLLEGSVRTGSGQLRVTAQLIDAHSGFQVWSGEFDGVISDVFAVQDEISARVVEGLQLNLQAGEEGARLGTSAATSIPAYDAFLLGRYHLARRTTEALLEAERQFRAAIEADPGYSPAWSGLATTLAVSPWYGLASNPAQTAEDARQAAERAIEIDARNSEAWAALGTVHLTFDRNWDEAAIALGRAVELHPNDATNVNLYGDLHYITGNYQQALIYESRAAELEPLSATHQHELALVHSLLNNLDTALSLESRAVQLSPEFRNAWSTQVRLLMTAGRLDEAQDVVDEKASLLGHRWTYWLEAQLALERGDREAALGAAQQLLELARDSDGSLTHVAKVFALLGEDSEAAALVREARQARDPILISPIYFFLPEDWPDLPELQVALDDPELQSLFDRRRGHIVAGNGRVTRP